MGRLGNLGVLGILRTTRSVLHRATQTQPPSTLTLARARSLSHSQHSSVIRCLFFASFTLSLQSHRLSWPVIFSSPLRLRLYLLFLQRRFFSVIHISFFSISVAVCSPQWRWMTPRVAVVEPLIRRMRSLDIIGKNSRSSTKCFAESRSPIVKKPNSLISMISFGFISIDSLPGDLTLVFYFWLGNFKFIDLEMVGQGKQNSIPNLVFFFVPSNSLSFSLELAATNWSVSLWFYDLFNSQVLLAIIIIFFSSDQSYAHMQTYIMAFTIFGFSFKFHARIGLSPMLIGLVHCFYADMYWMWMWKGQKMYSHIRDYFIWQRILLIDQYLKFALCRYLMILFTFIF